MVSTHPQYICPDFNAPLSSTSDVGSSPLAMLEKTCETIGLPDTPTKGKAALPATEKFSKSEQNGHDVKGKDDISPKSTKSNKSPRPSSSTGSTIDENGNRSKSDSRGHHHHHSSSKGDDSVATSSANAAAAALLNGYPRCFPGAFPTFPMPSSFSQHLAALGAGYPGMSGFGFPPAGLFPHSSGRCTVPMCKDCPGTSTGGHHFGAAASRCPTPGCMQCPPTGGGPMGGDFANLWLQAYQQSLGAAASHMPSPSLLSSLHSLMNNNNNINNNNNNNNNSNGQSDKPTQKVCNWVDNGTICGKQFASSEELVAHMKSHATVDQGKPSNANPLLPMSAGVPGRASPRSMYLNAFRFHPYGKLPTSLPPTSTPLAPHLPFSSPLMSPTSSYAATLSALYNNPRLLGMGAGMPTHMQ